MHGLLIIESDSKKPIIVAEKLWSLFVGERVGSNEKERNLEIIFDVLLPYNFHEFITIKKQH